MSGIDATPYHYALLLLGVAGWACWTLFIAAGFWNRWVTQRMLWLLRIGLPAMALPVPLLTVADWATGVRTGLSWPYLLATVGWHFASTLILLIVLLRVRAKRGWLGSESGSQEGPGIDLLRLRVYACGTDEESVPHGEAPTP